MTQPSRMPLDPLSREKPEFTIDLASGADAQISVVVVHHNRPEHLALTLQSISVASINNNYEVIVVDNPGEGDGRGCATKAYLEQIESDPSQNIKVVRNQKNLFWSESANRGFDATDPGSKYVVFAHHDVAILNPSWLDIFVNVAETKDAGFMSLDKSKCVIGDREVEYLQEWLCAFRRDAFEEIGRWPRELPQIAMSLIASIRAQRAGVGVQIAKNNSIAHHYRVGSLEVGEYERQQEKSLAILPKLIAQAQSRPLATGL